MSKTFLQIPASPIGTGPFLPISLCEPSAVAPAAIPFTVIWRTYGANTAHPAVAVNVNMQPAQNTLQIDKVKSVYIDNLGVDVPVYVYFPSTGFTVPAQPNSASWYPVITNDWLAVIIGEGFTDASAATTVTRVFFSNMQMAPYVSNELLTSVALWKASSVVSKGTGIQNTNYGVPALGDQTSTYIFDLSNPFSTAILATPQPSGFIYITGVTINLLNIQSALLGALRFNGSVSGNFLDWFIPVFNTQAPLVVLFNKSGMNLKFQATETLSIQNAQPITSGLAEMFFEWTSNPT